MQHFLLTSFIILVFGRRVSAAKIDFDDLPISSDVYEVRWQFQDLNLLDLVNHGTPDAARCAAIIAGVTSCCNNYAEFVGNDDVECARRDAITASSTRARCGGYPATA